MTKALLRLQRLTDRVISKRGEITSRVAFDPYTVDPSKRYTLRRKFGEHTIAVPLGFNCEAARRTIKQIAVEDARA